MGSDETMNSWWSKWGRESCVRIINEWWGGKTEENQEENNHSGMKGAACVSLWCTKQSQAVSLALHLSVYLGKEEKKPRGVEEEERGRGSEKCWKIVLTHTGQSPARSQTKKDNKDGKVFTVKGPGSSDVIITRALAEPEHGKSKNQTCCLFVPEKDLRRWTLLSTHIHKQGPAYWWSL